MNCTIYTGDPYYHHSAFKTVRISIKARNFTRKSGNQGNCRFYLSSRSDRRSSTNNSHHIFPSRVRARLSLDRKDTSNNLNDDAFIPTIMPRSLELVFFNTIREYCYQSPRRNQPGMPTVHYLPEKCIESIWPDSIIITSIGRGASDK